MKRFLCLGSIVTLMTVGAPGLVMTPVLAQSTSATTHCPHFAAAGWTKRDMTGNHYGISLTNETDCAQATKWAQKLMKGSSSGTFPYEVSGGPPGYKCYVTPDGSGGFLGGSCRKEDGSGKLAASFDWLAANK